MEIEAENDHFTTQKDDDEKVSKLETAKEIICYSLPSMLSMFAGTS
jgi:hypothetical protein